MSGYPVDGGWLTYKQAIACGGNVRKGEKSTVIFYYSKLKDAKKTQETGKDQFFMMMKTYLVFHLSQCENIDASKLFALPVKEAQAPRADLKITEVENFVGATNASINEITEGYARYVSFPVDKIFIHPIDAYENVDAYYSTLFHELIHWTGTRLSREFGKSMKSPVYGKEELIAELGACFLLPQFGLSNDISSAAYLNSWIKMLKETPIILFQVASAASTASAFLNAFSKVTETAEGDEIEQAA